MRSTTISRHGGLPSIVAPAAALLFAKFLLAPAPAHAQDSAPAPAQAITTQLEKIDAARFREIRTAVPATEAGIHRVQIRDLERTSNVIANAELRMDADGSMTIVQPSPSQQPECEGVVLTVTINGTRVSAIPVEADARARRTAIDALAAEIQPQVDAAKAGNADFAACFKPEQRRRRRAERKRAAGDRAARPPVRSAAEIIIP